MEDVLSLKNPLFKTYLFYITLLGLKMLIMSALTGKMRFKTKTFANPEDAAPMKVKPKINDDVERIRRAHLNDLENITVFTFISFVYVMCNPNVWLATQLFRIFTVTRFIHTLVYIFVVPQPSRAIAWFIGYAITWYMGIQCLMFLMV